jgi:DNA-binding MarR family transcriptional regulator
VPAAADPTTIATVRSFNRTVTQRIGVLEDRYLARDRPLGASRVLWEVGDDGTDARTLRQRLGLDSGYLSRLLRSLEAEGLVRTTPSPADQRVRSVRLTEAGRAERVLLDGRSDELAESILDPLDGPRRERLVEAMATVERLLTAGAVEVAAEEPTSDDARRCSAAYYAELDERFEGGFDPGTSHVAQVDELTPPGGVLLLARLHGRPVGCGGLRLADHGAPEIKRMWIDDGVRGLGVGRRLLASLEDEARQRGHRVVRLETNRSLTEAIALYRSAGYDEVEDFNGEPYADHWFEKHLD